jgi:hypothetical protein
MKQHEKGAAPFIRNTCIHTARHTHAAECPHLDVLLGQGGLRENEHVARHNLEHVRASAEILLRRRAVWKEGWGLPIWAIASIPVPISSSVID